MSAVFRQRLQDLRLRAGLTQESLAARSGLTHYAIRNWEQGHRLPSALALLRLARTLGVSMESLLEGVEEDEAPQAPPKKTRAQRKGS
jgi:transcriptional regulator with XRE-family HTH domain